MRIEASQTVDAPVAEVWRWYVDDHVHNHPRWDPDIQLEKISDGPLGLGTIIRRRNTRYGDPVEGTMEVVEYQPQRSIAMLIREGPNEMPGRAEFQAVGARRTRITISTEIPESIDETLIAAGMQRSVDTIKRLIQCDLA